MNKLYLVLLSAALVALLQSPAEAFKVGNVDVKTFASASGTYDSNVTYVKDNRKTDFVAGLTAGITGVYEGKLSAMQFAGSFVQQLFTENSSFNNTAEYANFSYSGELSRFDRFKFTETFSHSYEPSNFEDEFGRSQGRYSYYRNRTHLEYTHDITKQLALTARADSSVSFPSLATIKDSYNANVGGDLNYYVSSATILFGGYDASIRYFEDGKQSISNRLSGGIRQFFTKQVSLEARAGADYIIGYRKTDDVKPRFSVSLTDEFDQNTKGTIAFTKEYNTTSYEEDIFDYWQVSASGSKAFTERFRISGSCFYGHGEYVRGGVTDDLFGINAQASYDFTSHITGSISYNLSSTSSNFDTREYIRNAFYFGLTATF